MLNALHVLSQIVAIPRKSSLLFSQIFFRHCCRKTLPENCYPCFYSCSSNVTCLGCPTCFLCYPIIYLYLFLVCLLLQCAALFQSRGIFLDLYVILLISSSHLQWEVNLMGSLTFCVCILFFFVKLIVNCRLCVLGQIMVSLNRLWLQGLHGLNGPRYPMSKNGRQI